MTGADFRDLLLSMLPRDLIQEGAKRLGVQKRECVKDVQALIWSIVMAGGTEECGRLASALRAYEKETGREGMNRSTFYQWFDPKLLALFEELAAYSLNVVKAMPRSLPGLLAGRVDWRAVDSTVLKVQRSLIADFPGTGDYASIKVHKTWSLGAENIVDYHITSGRDHDAKELTIDETWRGMGLLVDLGYASFRLLRSCLANDVELVIRLKKGWNLWLDESGAAEAMASWQAGGDLAGCFYGDKSFVIPKTGTLDLDVTLGPANNPIPMRMIRVETPNRGTITFLTTLPRATHSAEDVGTLYRLRWNIELSNKLCKSAFRLDHITARTRVPAEILVHAAILAAVIANAFAHQDHLSRGFVGDKTPKLTESPIHPMLVAKSIAGSAQHLGWLLSDPTLDPNLEQWNRLARAIRHCALDPNWRNKPSVLDRVKGRVVPKGRPRSQKGPRLPVEGRRGVI